MTELIGCSAPRFSWKSTINWDHWIYLPQALNPTPNLCELETGPGSDGHRCLHNVLVGAEGLCQPTMELGGQGPSPSPATGGGSSPDCPSMEIPALVPSTAGDVRGLPQVASDSGQSNPASAPSINARSTAPASRVEYLRQRYKEQQFSEKATELMLSSWREKSSKAYES